MIVYEGTKDKFLNDVLNGVIAEKVADKILEKVGRHTGKAEFSSWQNSLEKMHTVLVDPEIPNNAGIAIEYNIPQTGKRVDFIVSGMDDSNLPNAIVIELKQWSEVKDIPGYDALVETFTGGAMREVVHPSYQAWSYATLIRDYNKTVQDSNVGINPCAYLHNYSLKDNDPLLASQYKDYIDEAPVFVKSDAVKLRDYIKKYIKHGDNKNTLYLIDNGTIRPSKSLQDSIASMLQGNQEFVMIDDQKVVYENIKQIALKSFANRKKYTVIVEGGPGTGKSVIAINLLAHLTMEGQYVQYTSKNSEPRKVYKEKLKGDMKKSSVELMFKGSGNYVDMPSDTVHTIIVDEAHRLNLKSGMFQNLGENQIKEIINASYCSVFFIDESQRIHIKDIGSVNEIEHWAKEYDSTIVKMQLTSQFRCNGSDGYLAWLDNVLDIRETANYDLLDINFDFKIFDNPVDLKKAIIEKNKINNKSRLLAGYCWDWIKEGKSNSDITDINIGDFHMSWNLDNTIFALDELSINQVGCVHTSQGLEFDYVGVIIGDDLRYENNHIITDFTKRARTDQSLKGIKTLYLKDKQQALKIADEIIKNTYRTLMTRGMKGCFIYCTDKNLRNYFKSKFNKQY